MFFKKLILTVSLTFSAATFAAPSKEAPIKVGIVAGPSAQVFAVAKKVAKEKYNLDIEMVSFTNYQIPNEAVNSGDIDMNVFQTVSFLNKFNAKRGFNLQVIGNTFIYPMGIFSKKIKTLAALAENSTIAIPNDLSNQGRALLLLNNAGVIKLKEGTGEFANISDILSNPKKLKIHTVDAGQIARVVQDVDAVVLNNDFVINAGFKPKDAIFSENANTSKPYINVIVVKESQKTNKQYLKFVEAMHSKEVVDKTLEVYPGAVKAW